MGPSMRAWAWRVPPVTAAGAVLLWFLVPGTTVRFLSYLLVGVLATVAAVLGARWRRPLAPAVWYLLAASTASSVAGDVTTVVCDLVLGGSSQSPSIADAFYLITLALAAAAIAALVRARTPGRDRASLIDAAIIATGVGLLTWVLLVVPTTHDTSLSVLGQAVVIAYPAADVLILAMLVRLLIAAGARNSALRLLVAAVALWLVADSLTTVVALLGTFSDQHPVVLLYLLSYGLIGAWALHPSAPALTQPAEIVDVPFTRRRLVLLTFASLIAPQVLNVQAAASPPRIDAHAIGFAATVLFLLVVVRMAGLIRQVQAQAANLAALAQRDGLTGIRNRRCWDTDLQLAIDRVRRDGTQLTVALVDIDFFKRFNDQFGHQAGDELLRGAATRWSAALRTTDHLYRYGGEEFGVLVPGATRTQAYDVLMRMRTQTPSNVTFSAGMASWSRGETAEQLVARADRALYQAKAAGRDRILVAGEAPAEWVLPSGPTTEPSAVLDAAGRTN
jgi:diguanylate cyclase (GGDEF)-like protein